MAFEFFSYPLAYNPAKVACMLAEKGIAHKITYIDLFNGQSLQPSYLKINPAGTVPALKHGDKIISDSVEIVKYLDSFDGKPLGGAAIDRAAAEQLVKDIAQWDGNLWAFANSSPGVMRLLGGFNDYKTKFAQARAQEHPELKEVYDRKIAAMKQAAAEVQDTAKVSANQQQLEQLLDTAEASLNKWAAQPGAQAEAKAAGGPFLAGPAYSIADVMLAPVLFRVTMIGRHAQLIAPRAALRAYMGRLKSRPSWDAAFGIASSGWGKASWMLPSLIKVKLCSLFGKY